MLFISNGNIYNKKVKVCWLKKSLFSYITGFNGLHFHISHAESHTKINVRSAGLRFALLDNTSPVISMAHISLHVTLDGSFLDTPGADNQTSTTDFHQHA